MISLRHEAINGVKDLWEITQRLVPAQTTAAEGNTPHMNFAHISHPPRLYDFSPLNDSYQHYNNCDDKQNVDEPTHRIAAHQPQQPQNYQYHSDCPQHLLLLPIGLLLFGYYNLK